MTHRKREIHISPKHGVNPTIPVCFFCEKPKNEIALLGKLPGDKEAPRESLLDYEPCDNCKALMAKGITLVECQEQPYANLPPITTSPQPLYPTGRWSVMKEEAIGKYFDDEAAASMLKHRKAFIDAEAAEKLGLFKEEIG